VVPAHPQLGMGQQLVALQAQLVQPRRDGPRERFLDACGDWSSIRRPSSKARSNRATSTCSGAASST
jgi:hypothetical protein